MKNLIDCMNVSFVAAAPPMPFLVVLGLTRMGRLIQFVPYPVVLGLTAGSAVVIAVLQILDFLGLETGKLRRAGIRKVAGALIYCTNLERAHAVTLRWQAESLVVRLESGWLSPDTTRRPSQPAGRPGAASVRR